ncbi:hypothetical protein C8J57DRAFT_1303988 [Mycena rebaudengoi]|nr:hypothetical protein C8J57DRAFT_1303988 [Mycena rebaudengoi]
MAHRRAQAQTTRARKTESLAPAEDFDFLASQQSSSSDDQAMQLAIAQQLMASKEKKRKDMEKKFFQAAKKQLTNEISNAAQDVKSTIDTTETIYSKFLFDYAASEDAIRALWMEIKKEEQKLLELAKKLAAATAERGDLTEKAQIAGMAQVREACYENRRIIDTIVPA